MAEPETGPLEVTITPLTPEERQAAAGIAPPDESPAEAGEPEAGAPGETGGEDFSSFMKPYEEEEPTPVTVGAPGLASTPPMPAPADEPEPGKADESRDSGEDFSSFMEPYEEEEGNFATDVTNQAEKFLQSTLGGAAEGGGFTIGAVGGAMYGSALGPWGTIGGFLIGGIGGWLAGQMAAKGLEDMGLAVADPYELPEDERVAGVAGNTFGNILSGMGFVTGMSRTTLRVATGGKGINMILDYARNKPFKFLAAETFAGVQASGAAAVAEHVWPGNIWARAGSELYAGFLSPGRLAVLGGSKVYNLAKRYTTQQFSSSAYQPRAAKLLQRVTSLVEEGKYDNPAEHFVAVLADADELAKTIPGFRGTAAQTTGDVYLAAYERDLAEHDRAFQETAERLSDEATRAIVNYIRLLRADVVAGHSDAIPALARAVRARYDMMLDRTIQQGMRDAVKNAEEVLSRSRLTKQTKSELGRDALGIIMKSLRRAREVERQLWSEALPDPAQHTNWGSVLKVFDRLTHERAPGEKVPAAIADAVAEVRRAHAVLARAAEGKEVAPEILAKARRTLSVSKLQEFRSFMLDEAANWAVQVGRGTDRAGRRYGLMAEAALDDMVQAGVATVERNGRLRGKGGRFASPINDRTPYDDARAFSRALNDAYERSFVGKLFQETHFGLSTPPEVTLARAFTGGDEAVALRLHEMQEVVDFLPVRPYLNPIDLKQVGADVGDLMDVQENYLNLMLAGVVEDVVDPKTGAVTARVSVAAARRFLRDSAEIADRFPELMRSLEQAVQSEQTLKSWAARVMGLRRRFVEPLAKVWGVDSPADAVAGALSGRQPIQALDELRQSAAVARYEDLHAAFWDFAINRATVRDADGTLGLNLSALIQAFDAPIRPGLPSLREYMTQHGVMPPVVSERLDDVFEMFARVAVAQRTRASGEIDISDMPSAISELAMRVAGSWVGRHATRVMPGKAGAGESLIAATAGVRLSRSFFDRLPHRKAVEMLRNAMVGENIIPGGARDWSLFNTLMRGSTGEAADTARYLALHAYAWHARLLVVEGIAEDVGGNPKAFQRGPGKSAPSPFEGFMEPFEEE